LNGLESRFNDNAANRSVVLHGGWYVEEPFIKRYGRAGRSWGCPAVPDHLVKPIVNAIKENSLMVVFYPSDQWFSKSKFLNCHSTDLQTITVKSDPEVLKEAGPRDGFLFVDSNKNERREENEPVVVMSANDYERIFQTKVPLTRMLRRQINNQEYVVLNTQELERLDSNMDHVINELDSTVLSNLFFVIPVVKMERGYYATEMQMVLQGKIKEVQLTHSPIVQFQTQSLMNIKSSKQFTRWLGL
jgi:hypothetical protein